MKIDTDQLISIIVPVYNAEKYIANTIRMVQAQTYSYWELILVNDCSCDGTKGIIEDILTISGCSSDIFLINNIKNVGAALARNTGLSKARGRYIAFLDADDVWKPDKLEKELKFMNEKKAAFAFTAYEFGDSNSNGTGKVVHVPETLKYGQALSRTVIFTSTVMFDCTLIDIKLLEMKNIKSEDTATWWRILRSGYTAYGLDEVTAIYTRPAVSLSSNKLEALKRIWYLYRKEEKLTILKSACCFVSWACRATARRL